MKTQVVEFSQTHVGDILKVDGKYVQVVEDPNGQKYVRGYLTFDDIIVERVITKNPLVRLKRYLVG